MITTDTLWRSTITAVLVAMTVLSIAGCSQRSTSMYQGYIEGRFVYISSPQSGRLDSLSATRGEIARIGTPLFRLESEPESDEVRQSENILRTEATRLADLITGKRPTEIDVREAQLREATAEEQQADETLTIDEAQFRAGGISKSELIQVQGTADTDAEKVQEVEGSASV